MHELSPQDSLKHYFRIKNSLHRDLLVDVPMADFRRLFDNGREIDLRLKQDLDLTVTAEAAEQQGGGSDAFFLHKAIILARSIQEKGILAPVHAHWYYKGGQWRHPSNDKASVIAGMDVGVTSVPVLWRDCAIHHEAFPDHDYTSWWQDFEYVEIENMDEYAALYGDDVFSSGLCFEARTHGWIWDHYPDVWGKLKPVKYFYDGVDETTLARREAREVAYCGVFDRYHRQRMQGNTTTLAEILPEIEALKTWTG